MHGKELAGNGRYWFDASAVQFKAEFTSPMAGTDYGNVTFLNNRVQYTPNADAAGKTVKFKVYAANADNEWTADGIEFTVTVKQQPSEGSSNANLSVLSYQVGEGEPVPVPGFSPDVTAYTVELPEGTALMQTITLTGVCDDENADAVYTSAITNWEYYRSDATATVTAENKTATKKYTVSFYVKPEDSLPEVFTDDGVWSDGDTIVLGTGEEKTLYVSLGSGDTAANWCSVSSSNSGVLPINTYFDGIYPLYYQLFKLKLDPGQEVSLTISYYSGDKVGEGLMNTLTLYIVQHDHIWGNEWSCDDTHHWHACADENCPAPDSQGDLQTHTGGTATCSQLAVCELCGSQYGDLNPDNHKAVSEWTQENGKHYHKCEYGCDAHLDETDCSGGEATCTALAVCETCGNSYGAINPDNHTGEIVWTKTATDHSSAYDCCGATVVAKEAHEWENGVCSECGYECQHDGGTATCADKAVCDTCGEEYGEVNASNHTNLVKTEAKPATHMTEGNIEYWYCDGCEKYFSDEAGTKEIALVNTVIPKLAEHTVDGTGWHSDETGHWNTCECGEKLNEAAHTFEWVIDKEATVTEAGSRHEKCTVCGYEKAAVEIPAMGTTEDPSKPPADTSTPSGNDQTGHAAAPQTGDDGHIGLWMALLLASGAGISVTGVVHGKRYGKTK